MSTDNFRKYQIFISSTYTDLIDERRLIIDALLKMDFIPAGMEMFVASNTEQFKVITKVIDLCDYYLLIIGKRYGTINEDTHLYILTFAQLFLNSHLIIQITMANSLLVREFIVFLQNGAKQVILPFMHILIVII